MAVDVWGDKYWTSAGQTRTPRSVAGQTSTAPSGPVRSNAYTTGQQQQYNANPQGPQRNVLASTAVAPAPNDATGSHGSWAGITATPEYQAQTLQNQKNQDILGFLQGQSAANDTGYMSGQARLAQQLGLSEEATGLQNQGYQISHDQTQALNNLIINNQGRDTSFIERALGLAGQSRDQDMARQGLSDQGLGLDAQDLLTNLYRSRRQLNNQYTAGGGWFTPERGLSHQDLNKGWETGQGRINIGYAGNNINRQSIGTQYEQAQLAHDKALAATGDEEAKARLSNYYNDQGLNNQIAQNNQAQAGTAAGLQYQGQQLGSTAIEDQKKFFQMLHDMGLG